MAGGCPLFWCLLKTDKKPVKGSRRVLTLVQNLIKSRSPCFSACSKLAPTALRTVERRAKTIGFGVGKIEVV